MSGRSFADSPEWTGNIALEYEFDSGLFANLNANYQNSSIAYLDNERSSGRADFDPKNDGRLLINAQVGYDFGSYLVRFDVRNLLDEQYINRYLLDIENPTSSYGQHQLDRSRQISLSLQAHF
nr:TonB-dependent receptor [Paraglaciecola arctica]